MKRLFLLSACITVLCAVFAIGYFSGSRPHAIVPDVMAAPALSNPDNVNGNWQVNVNGIAGSLILNQDPASGGLTGLVNTGGSTLGQFLLGFYNRVDGRVVFLRVVSDFSDPTHIVERTAAKSQVFLGNAFVSSGRNFITGAFFNFSPQASEGGATANQFNFGWFAQK